MPRRGVPFALARVPDRAKGSVPDAPKGAFQEVSGAPKGAFHLRFARSKEFQEVSGFRGKE